MVAAGGAAALAPVSFAGSAGAAPVSGSLLSGSLVTLLTPIRIYDSRIDDVPLGRAKLESGSTVIVTVSVPDEPRFLRAAFLNVTITGTEGSGFLRVNGTDSSDTLPVPATSNINWSQSGQTLANLALTSVGSEFGVDIFAGGGGRTHVIVDVQGYVPSE
jgi:hypothetical protein